MRVIVNADDLGSGVAINREIFRLIANGRITSATLLANGSSSEDAARQAKEFPQCSFGAHLNVSEFKPLVQDPDMQPLLNSRGEFAGNIREVVISSRLRKAILQEWCAQVEKLLQLGISVTHIYSHHHVHTIPALFPVLRRLRCRFGIRKVRTTMNIYPTDAPASAFLRARKTLWKFGLRHVCRMRTTDGFTSLRIFCERGGDCPARYETVELMVHPGGRGFDEETRLLESEWWKSIGRPVDAMINYGDLD